MVILGMSIKAKINKVYLKSENLTTTRALLLRENYFDIIKLNNLGYCKRAIGHDGNLWKKKFLPTQPLNSLD